MTMIHEITASVPRNKRPMRKGRGRSAGKGKTAGKGTKGMKARAGAGVRTGYEGGQTEIFRRFPKKGFSNVQFERKFHVVNLSDLEKFDDGATVDAAALIARGVVPDTRRPVKILGDGEITKRLTVSAARYSQSALRKLTAVGGTTQDALGQPVAAETASYDSAGTDGEDDDSTPGGTAPDGGTPSVGEAPESGTRTADAPGAANVSDTDPSQGTTGGDEDDASDQPDSGTR